jgi:hypothetical protein
MKTLMQKGLRRAVMALILGLFTAQAYGAEIFYVPQATDVSVDAGSSKTVPMTVGLTGLGRSDLFRLYFLNSVSNGNLPSNWLQVFPGQSFLSSFLQSDTTDVTIVVPEGTPPGLYSGQVQSLAMGFNGLADPGPGMLLNVRVASRCIQMPTIGIGSFSPNTIWPPNHRMVEVNVSGNISAPDGCTLSGATFKVEDEYGEIPDQEGDVTLDDNGDFNLSVSVEASRNGNDPDGRTYVISLMASDDLGSSTTMLNAVVPHDMRGK